MILAAVEHALGTDPVHGDAREVPGPVERDGMHGLAVEPSDDFPDLFAVLAEVVVSAKEKKLRCEHFELVESGRGRSTDRSA